ncbi:MAG: hypothetical protein JXA37_05530 [Chloroflexia bacterium]|nr:hypothetical protein [Chloroflexia bacterium]
MSKSGRSSDPEQIFDWENISRSAITPSSISEAQTSEEQVRWLESLQRSAPKQTSGLFGCGCLSLIGLISGVITLLLSILMLAGGKAGSFVRELIQAPDLSRAEIWGTLVAPSVVLIMIGLPFTIWGVREWHQRKGASAKAS